MRRVSLRNPVNRRDPLAAGLALWLSPLAQHAGGPTWHDLTRRTAGATLVGSPAWTPTPYGAGLALDGSSQYGTFGGPLPGGPGAFAVAAAVRLAATGSFYGVLDSGSSGGRWRLQVDSTGHPSLTAPGVSDYPSGTALPVGAWCRLLAVYDGQTTVRYYQDGARTDTLTVAGYLAATGAGEVGRIAGAFAWFGGLSDPSVWSLSPLAAGDPDAFAALDYAESRRGDPGALRRARRRAWLAGGGTAAKPWWPWAAQQTIGGPG